VLRSPFARQGNATSAAFLIAPLVPSMLSAVLSPIGSHWALATLVGFFVISYLITLAFEVALGLPILLLMARFRLVRWWTALISGLIVGVVVAIALRLPNLVEVRDVLVLGLEGAASAFTFWVVWILGPEPNDSEVRKWVTG
jgi:hypothetical protein